MYTFARLTTRTDAKQRSSQVAACAVTGGGITAGAALRSNLRAAEGDAAEPPRGLREDGGCEGVQVVTHSADMTQSFT